MSEAVGQQYFDAEGNLRVGVPPPGAALTGQEWLDQQRQKQIAEAEADLKAAQDDSRSPSERVRRMGRGWYAENLGGGGPPSAFATRKAALEYLQRSDKFVLETRAARLEELRQSPTYSEPTPEQLDPDIPPKICRQG